ncbi:hypothetical protein L873DRAFT_1779235 [Choiromyces venosus 120613-1]|uniref:Uncharacterized protein n=1 Tax=Choiromyces venosus 120613-1 TaxID=1336337 RepID=A0A3N4J7G9_9PEZI|nr:hypothetical protein L873DRAFT_1779235 [Choiromyces venosus 120613-1]
MAVLQQGQVNYKQRLLDLQQGQAGILQYIQCLEDSSSPSKDKNNIAQAINSTSNLRVNFLELLYGLNGLFIPNFLRTGADIERLSSDGINALLVVLRLEVTGTAACKECFKRYIGFVISMD